MQPSNHVHKPILVVEDDIDIRETLSEFLESEGYRVCLAANGREGIEQLRSMNRPCLVLLDLFMPILDGIGFLETLQKDHGEDTVAALPIVVVSAAPPEGEIAKKAKSLTTGFIKKPLDLEIILRVVEKHCCDLNANDSQ
jgi:CheY-like chemotaxis protein